MNKDVVYYILAIFLLSLIASFVLRVPITTVVGMDDGAVITINKEHYEIHEGDHYFIKTFLIDTAGTGSTTYFSFTTPNTSTRIHAKSLFSPDVDTEINIYENSIITDGSPITEQNNDRDSNNTAELVAVASPTIVVIGDKIWSARNGGGINPVGISPGFNYEIVAKTNTTYTFEIIKRTTADLIIDIDFWWYEE